MRTPTIGLSTACLMLAMAGCKPEAAKVAKTAGKTAVKPAEPAAQSPWDAEVLAAAEQYKAWQRVSDQANWSPLMCDSPPPSGALLSEAASNTPNGRKLYYLFVKDAPDYFKMTELGYDQEKREHTLPADVQQPVGQVVIKEAHKPEPATLTEASKAMTQADRDQRRAIPLNFARTDDGLFRTGEPAGLFAMIKVAPDTAGTDQGWVYATISPAGDITSIGAVESCMDCHIKAPSDRLFGPEWSRGFERAAANGPTPSLADSDKARAPASPWDEQLIAAARNYKSWKRVSDQARWSPAGCLAPVMTGNQLSEAPEATPHGRKLYYLFAKNDEDYLKIQYPIGMAGDINDTFPENVQQPTGQIIVKEAFHPSEPTDIEPASPSSRFEDSDGFVRPGQPAELFVMLKTPPETPGTDKGWVYATISPSEVITSVGTIESCIDCHVKAPHDRLFGTQWHNAINRPKPPAR